VVGISLTAFDDNKFSILYYKDLDVKTVEIVSRKTLTILSIGVAEQKDKSSAIIPIMEENLIVYVFLFKKAFVYSIAFSLNSDQQLTLYKCIPLLEKHSKEFLKELEEKEIILHDSINNSESINLLLGNLSENTSKLLSPELNEENKGHSSPIFGLIQLLGNGVHIFYRALLLNEKTVLFAEKTSNILDFPWKDFVPHKQLNIIAYPSDPRSENQFDIMIVEPNRKKECDAECVILEIQSGKVENGKSDKYLENFFKNLKTLESTNLSLEINLEINNLFNWVHEIIDVSTNEKDENIDQKIKELIEFHTKTRFGDRLPLLTAIAKKYNDYATDRIKAYFLKELGIFKKDIKSFDSKKLLSKL
jgi:hypothetical protein